MSKPNKVKILEGFCINGKSGEAQNELVFKVQLSKGEEPITMFYDQVKLSYPNALIDFYERQFRDKEESEVDQLSEELQELFDYDTYLSISGSKILEHINSFTLSSKRFDDDLKKKNPTGSERVFEQEVNRFYLNFIQNPNSEGRHISRPMSQIETPKAKPDFVEKVKINKSKKK